MWPDQTSPILLVWPDLSSAQGLLAFSISARAEEGLVHVGAISLCALATRDYVMPKVRRAKKPPEGLDIIKPTLEDFKRKMREGKCD